MNRFVPLLLAFCSAVHGAVILQEQHVWTLDGSPMFSLTTTVLDNHAGDFDYHEYRYTLENVGYVPGQYPCSPVNCGAIRGFGVITAFETFLPSEPPPARVGPEPVGWTHYSHDWVLENYIEYPYEHMWVTWGTNTLPATFSIIAPAYAVQRRQASIWLDAVYFEGPQFRAQVPVPGIPEPSSFLLMAAGLTGIGVVARRRRTT